MGGGDKSWFIQLLEKVEGQYSLLCRFNLVEGDFTWIVTMVYDPRKVERKEFFFGGVGYHKRPMGGPMVHRWRLQRGQIPQWTK